MDTVVLYGAIILVVVAFVAVRIEGFKTPEGDMHDQTDDLRNNLMANAGGVHNRKEQPNGLDYDPRYQQREQQNTMLHVFGMGGGFLK